MRDAPDGNDPRRAGMASSRDDGPVVGEGRSTNLAVIVGAFALLAVALFLLLNGRRSEQEASLVTPAATTHSATAAPAQPPPLQVVSAPQPTQPPPAALAPQVPITPIQAAPTTDLSQNLKSPAVVVDLQAGLPAPAPAQVASQNRSATDTSSDALHSASGAGGSFGANQQFAAEASASQPEAAVATQMTHLSATISQGATIPGVLETAVNSDLPGYTRAVVSRDVRSFDGKAVLIPRGSRLIGQYRSALSLGQSRVFIIWTRVIRPDGVSVQIGSPGDDALGRGGLTGEVNSHFFTRFGGAVLLSVLNTGLAAVAGTPSTQVVIGSPAAAVGAAASAVVPTGENVLPTIQVDQGAAITIFVARDLDFSIVKPVP